MTHNNITEHWKNILVETSPVIQASASEVLAASEYLNQWGQRYPEQAKTLLNSDELQRIYDDTELSARLAERLLTVTEESALHQQLREFRHYEMVRIIWRDLAGWSELAETMQDLSNMADVCISQSLALLHQWQTELYGRPLDKQGNEQQLIVLGMGKLGARELNLSSDVDLIFVYPEQGETQSEKRPRANSEFFTRVGQKLIQALDNRTADGFVFRVDMRLRPFGDSGALVSSFDDIEDYYQTQAREWERYAMIKARCITGSSTAQQQLTGVLQPFVFRQYLDYGTFESLREMKSMIESQLHLKGMEDNVKLGAGGIREIEFIGQLFQLIYGGRDRPLQQRPILTILDLLVERQLLSDYAVAELKEAYVFLRRTEHRLQAWADQQTHTLPTEPEDKQRLSISMGFADWQGFSTVLNDYRQQVQQHFDQLLISPQSEDESDDKAVLLTASEPVKLQLFSALAYNDPQACLDRFNKLLEKHSFRSLVEVETNRLNNLLPLLVQAAAGTDNPDECWQRLIPLLEAIVRRSTYISLLLENPMALSQLVKLCSASPLISEQLARHPILLDELLDPRSLYQVSDKQELAQLLSDMLASVDSQDLEQQMHRLREFRQIISLKVAAADIMGVLPLMKVGDQLSELAEVLLARVWQLAWQYTVARHGYPPITDHDDVSQSGFVVLAYGKLGGLELGYGSDLDLVFIFDDSQQGMTSGAKPLDPGVFYTRVAQRMIHIIDTTAIGGRLYEVDTRLRPSGASGLLVSPLSGFDEYQIKEAWTWEHQSLVRARCVLGDKVLEKKVRKVRNKVLSAPRDPQSLKEQVADMRQKMRSQIDKSNADLFDLKQGKGGITDIEFMVQYAVLAWSESLPDLLIYTDNIRILSELVKSGKLTEQQGETLADAYRYYRALANHCALQERERLVLRALISDNAQQVIDIWQRWLGED